MKLSIACLVPAAACLSCWTALAAADSNSGPVPVHKANYELATRWTPAKAGKLVFDMAVTPHWLTDDRFWYSYETTHGRHFYLVDPAKKTKVPVFDNARMAEMLTEITRNPYDGEHLPIRTIKFTHNDTVVEFEVQVDRDADVNGKQTVIGVEQQTETTSNGQNDDPQQRGRGGAATPANPRMRTLYFEYDLASMKLTLPAQYTPEPRKPLWASISPDEKTVVFARKYDLYMMDAASYAIALQRPDDPNIKEIRLTTDGEDGFSYARRISGTEMDQIRQRDRENQTNEYATMRDKSGRVPPITIHWSEDSKRFAVVRTQPFG